MKRSRLGKLHHCCASVEIVDEMFAAATRQLLSELPITESIPTEIIGAIPTDDCIVTSLTTDSSGDPKSAQRRLRQSIRQSNLGLDQLTFDELTWHWSDHSVVSLTATAQDRIRSIREAITGLGHQWRSLQPAPSSLVGNSQKTIRRERTATRLFVGETSLLGVMTQGPNLVHWQSQPLPPGEEERGIALIAQAIESEAKAKGFEPSQDGIRIHGRHELQSLIDHSWLRKKLARDYQWLEGPAMKPELIAQACAEQFYSRRQNQFNFVRPTPSEPVVKSKPICFPETMSIKKTTLYALAITVVILVIADQLRRCREDYSTSLASLPTLELSRANPPARLTRFAPARDLVSQSLDKPTDQRRGVTRGIPSIDEAVAQNTSRKIDLADPATQQEDQGSPIELVFHADYVIDLAGAPSQADALVSQRPETPGWTQAIVLTGIAQLGKQSWAVINGENRQKGDRIRIPGHPAVNAVLLSVERDHAVIEIDDKTFRVPLNDPPR